MFEGITETSLDAKGRIAVPARYRDEIETECGGHLVVTAHVDRCLLICPFPEWQRIRTDLLNIPNASKQVRLWHRLYIGYAKHCNLDAQSRITLSSELRKFANISKNVCLVGQGAKFELWNDQDWFQTFEDGLEKEANGDGSESVLSNIFI